jgi:hypothetical protein
MVNAIAESTAAAMQERSLWLSKAHRRYQTDYVTLRISTHGLLLQRDLEAAFKGGAWASVIVLAQAVIEATLRDLETCDYAMKPKTLFKGNRRLERIRALRNELVHPQAPGTPSLVWRVGGGDFVANHARLEADAKRAVEYMLYLVYQQRDADG